MQLINVRRAGEADIPFLVEAIMEAEASGSQNISYREIFSLDDSQTKDLLQSILLEEIEGCGLSTSEFLIAETNGEEVACCGAWIEGVGGLSSNILKSQLLIEVLGVAKWEMSINNINAVAEINIDRTPGVLQIESVYTRPQYRGKGVSSVLIHEHLLQAAKIGIRSAEIQLMKNNINAIKAYRKAGFACEVEKNSKNKILGRLLPYHCKIRMRKD